MSFRSFFILMGLVCVAAWISWLVALFAIDPTATGWIGFCLFYLTLTLAFLSTLTLVGTGIRVWFHKDELIYRQVKRSLRQSFLFTALFICSLYLAGKGLLAWWVLFLLVVIVAFLELIFLGSHENPSNS